VFFANAARACCAAGDMIIFNARTVHAAGINTTQRTRHSLTINFCRSYMRQRFDFPRLVPREVIDGLGEKGRRLIGMNVRMPTSLDEFYLPIEQRLYKPNQG
jgi:ectoine hydroxylase-related dioxygenase (phytanoyl-CoA dioxygenase family)